MTEQETAIQPQTYCIKCKTKTPSINITNTSSNNRKIIKSECSVCKTKRSRFGGQLPPISMPTKGKGLDIQKAMCKIPGRPFAKHSGEKHLPQHNFTGACTNLDKRLDYKDKPKQDSIPINRVDQAAYRHDLKYRDNQDLATRHIADRVMVNELDNIQNPTLRERAERTLVNTALKTKLMLGVGLAEEETYAAERHKEFRRPKFTLVVKVSGKDNIWSADLVDMTKKDEGNKFILTVIDLYTRYAWAIPLTDKRGVTITEAFKHIFKTSNRKPEKLWTDKGTEFYNKTFKELLSQNNIEIYSTENEGKAVMVERFNRTLKSMMWKEFTKQGNQRWVHFLPSLLEIYNNRVHSSTNETPKKASENPSSIRDKIFQHNIKNENLKQKAKYKVGDRVRIFKYKNKFYKGYKAKWTNEIFKVVEVMNTKPITYRLYDLNKEEILGRFYQNELQRTTF